MSHWRYFPITITGAVEICQDHGFAAANVAETPPVSHCLRTGAKITWHHDYGFVIYGYAYDESDTLPYRRYLNVNYQAVAGVWYLKRIVAEAQRLWFIDAVFKQIGSQVPACTSAP